MVYMVYAYVVYGVYMMYQVYSCCICCTHDAQQVAVDTNLHVATVRQVA